MVWVRHSEGPPFRRSGTIVQSSFTGIKTDSANKRYLFNAIPDTNHNANPTNPNRYSNGMADLRNGGPLPNKSPGLAMNSNSGKPKTTEDVYRRRTSSQLVSHT